MNTDWVKPVVSTALATAGTGFVAMALYRLWALIPREYVVIGGLWIGGLALLVAALYVSGRAR